MEIAEQGNNETNDVSKLSEKSQKLVEKVNLLTEKIETEKSPLKKHILAFRVKMIISKIQREIDLHNIREYYQLLRNSLKSEKEKSDVRALDNIAELSSKIKKLERELGGNEEYDAESPYFMYPAKFVKESGGIENLTKKLKQSKKIESQQAARKIEIMAQKRKELDVLYETLKSEQDRLDNSQDDYKANQKDYSRQEKMLIIRQKINIFARIGVFFKTMTEQTKLYFDERKQNKELTKLQKADEVAIDEEYRKKMDELKREYRDAKEKHRESRKQEQEARKDIYGKDMAEQLRITSDQVILEENQTDVKGEEPMVPAGEEPTAPEVEEPTVPEIEETSTEEDKDIKARMKLSQEYLKKAQEIDGLTTRKDILEWINNSIMSNTQLSEKEKLDLCNIAYGKISRPPEIEGQSHDKENSTNSKEQ